MTLSQRVNRLLTARLHDRCGNLFTPPPPVLCQTGKDHGNFFLFSELTGLHRALVKAWKGPSNLVRRGLSEAFSAGFSSKPVENSVLAFFHMARERILLIEDEPDIAEVLQYNLEKEGFQVELARRGDTGLEMVRKEHPDLILLDLM